MASASAVGFSSRYSSTAIGVPLFQESLFYGEDGVDGGGFFYAAWIDSQGSRCSHRAFGHGLHQRARWLGLGFVAGEGEGAEPDVEAFGHLAGYGAGALEGFGGGFGLGGVL